MKRRGFLATVGGMVICPLCARHGRADEAAAGPKWSYAAGSPIGPTNWGTLSPSYATCGTGAQQSPVDLRVAAGKIEAEILKVWGSPTGEAANDGHSISFTIPKQNVRNTVTFAGIVYTMRYLHFHAPSEHLIVDKPATMEVHFVHVNEATASNLVVGVLLQRNPLPAPQDALLQIMQALPLDPKDYRGPVEVKDLALNSLMPGGGPDRPIKPAYTYAGSLTTPPCGETVTWLVCANMASVNPQGVDRFLRYYSGNARPLQPLYRRFILKTN